jgi:hypothetical protein
VTGPWNILEVLAYCGLGLLTSVVTSFLLLRLSGRLIEPSRLGRKKLRVTCLVAPFLAFAWVAVVFHEYSKIVESKYHRDDGFAFCPYAPLPNGYIMALCGWGIGCVYPPGNLGDCGKVPKPSVQGVYYLQSTDRYILGNLTSGGAYFIFDVQTRTLTGFATLDELKTAAAAKGIELNLEAFWVLYHRLHRTPFEIEAKWTMAAGPLLMLSVLAFWIYRLRRPTLNSQLVA